MSGSHDSAAGPPLSRWEVLGAWLHVWTPPRGARVPPVPWRRIGIWTAICAVALGVAAVIAVPRIATGKREGEARDAAALARARAADRREIERAQTPHFGRLPGAGPARAVPARRRLVTAARAAVLADARARVRAGLLENAVLGLSCQGAPAGTSAPAHPELESGLRRAALDCTAITGRIAATKHNAAGLIGYPFRLKLDFERARYVWCKETPPPGEQVIPDPRSVVPLPRACRL